MNGQALRFAVGGKVTGGELAESAVDAIGNVVRFVFHTLAYAFFDLAGNFRVVLGELSGGDAKPRLLRCVRQAAIASKRKANSVACNCDHKCVRWVNRSCLLR